MFSVGKLAIMDATSGEITQQDTPIQLDGADISPLHAATYDPSTGKIYMVYWKPDYSKGLCTIDPETFEVAHLCDMPGYTLSIAAAPDGKIYFMNYPNSLYSLDKTTGENTLISSNAKPEGGKGYLNRTASQTAAFDWSTGQMYLANLTADWNTHLTKIDPVTGKAVNVADFPGSERMVGLFIPYADPATPGFASKIGYADGKLSFNAPSMAYSSGEAITGTLTAYVSVDGAEPQAHSVQAGELCTIDMPLADGRHIIEISMGNSAGKSPARRLTTFIGKDVPSAVTGLALAIDNGEDAVLSWAAPTTSMQGGEVDDATINYRIVRYPDEVVVAESHKETTFTEKVPDKRAHYYYKVTAMSNSAAGGEAVSNEVPAGSVYYPPFVETFDTQADFDFFKVVDNNADENTWMYLPKVQIAYLQGNGVYDPSNGQYGGTFNDDYLISSSVKLMANTDYRLSFKTGNCFLDDETLTVLLGTSKEVKGDETKLGQVKLSSYDDSKEHVFIFSVPSDGLYNVLFHGDTQGNSVNINFDDFGIEVYSQYAAPDSVTDIKVTAGDKGALVNTLSFNAPTKTYKNADLGSISKIDIYRNGSAKPVKTFENPEVGANIVWTDTDVEQGLVTYTVVPFNAEGQGKTERVTNWVGLDVPANVTGLKAEMNDDLKMVATWNKVGDKGAHGGYVNPDDVQYVLCRYNEYNFDDHYPAITEPTSELTITDTDSSPLYGERQQYIDYLLVATNSAGKSSGYPFGLVLGEPYERPYTEAFPGGYVEKNPWTLFASTYYYAWNNVTGSGLAVKPYDNDGGMLQFSYIMDESNTQKIAGPRVSMKDAVSPELSFYMYHGFEAEPEDLQLDVYTNSDDAGWVKAVSVPYNNGADGWARYSLQLDANAGDVQIAFGAFAADASASIYIDNISIDESVAKDMALQSIRADKRIEMGESITVQVAVANYGTEAANNVEVKLYRDGAEYATQQVATVNQNEVKVLNFDINTTREDAGKTYIFSAEAAFDGDANADNNVSGDARVFVHGSSMPVATNLAGTTDDGTVSLTWQASATDEMADALTDDFDSYESFIIDGIGDWTTYDGDGTQTVYFGGPSIANAYEPKAWQVWAPEEAGFSLEKFSVLTPHSGDKYLASWAASDGASKTLESDDWLISSDVVGGTDVSFWYRVPNEGSDAQVFEMMYSTTDNQPESFTAFDRDSLIGTTDWVQFEYTLPADAKYFAIRNCTYGSYTVAFIDDLSYTPLYGTKTKLTLEGYNVYRDNELVATKVNGTTWQDPTAGDVSHVYAVTAVWKEGESNYSNTYLSEAGTGIETVANGQSVVVVPASGCVKVLNAGGALVRVFTPSGNMVYADSVADSASISLAKGVYMVDVNGRTSKIIVR